MFTEVTGSLPAVFGLTKNTLKRATAFFATRSAMRVGLAIHGVSVVLVRDVQSDEAHRLIMGVSGATDVITEVCQTIPPEQPGIYGELVVNTDCALRVAPKRSGWSPAKELLLYVAHGCDHLSGAEDISSVEYARMRRRELRWVNDFIAKEHF